VRAIIITLLAAATLGQADSPLVDRVRDTAIIQVEADSFNSLTPRQKALAYWLSQAAIAIDPIIYDQESRFGLRQRRLLEAVVSNKDKVDPPAGRGKSPRESIF
jgi:dipeptidyl-peptidase-3